MLFRFIHCHSDERVTLSEFLLKINHFGTKMLSFLRKFLECSSKIARVNTIHVSNPINIAMKSTPKCNYQIHHTTSSSERRVVLTFYIHYTLASPNAPCKGPPLPSPHVKAHHSHRLM